VNHLLAQAGLTFLDQYAQELRMVLVHGDVPSGRWMTAGAVGDGADVTAGGALGSGGEVAADGARSEGAAGVRPFNGRGVSHRGTSFRGSSVSFAW
jgi:hypothetical protein